MCMLIRGNIDDVVMTPLFFLIMYAGLLILNASIDPATNSVQCKTPRFGSAGNTSVCVVMGPVDPWAAAPPAGQCNTGADKSKYAPAYFERFALFSPQFGRR